MRGRILSAALLVGVMLATAACSSAKPAPAAPEPAPAPGQPAPAPADPRWAGQILWQVGPQAGSTGATATGVSTIAAKVLPGVSVTLESTNGLTENLVKLTQGVGNTGWAQPNELLAVLDKKGQFANAKYTDLWATIPMQSIPWFFLTTEDTGIKTLDDLATKPNIKISMNAPNSGSETTHKETLTLLGLWDQVQPKTINMSHADAAAEMAAGRIQAHAMGGFVPAFSELALRKKIVLVPPSEAHLQKILAEVPHFYKMTFNAGKYYPKADPQTTYGFLVFGVAASAVPDDVVYKLTKGVFENRPVMEAAYAAWSELKAEDMAALNPRIKLHPGAAKYYREIGLTIPDEKIGKR